MPAPYNISNQEAPSRKHNALRVGRFGVIVGALVGLLTGHSFGAAVIFGGVGALGGAVAGNTLVPIIDRITGIFHRGRHKKHAAENGVESSPLIQQAQAVAPEVTVSPVGALGPEQQRAAVLSASAAASANVEGDRMALDGDVPPNSELWVSKDAAGKRPNAEGPATRQ